MEQERKSLSATLKKVQQYNLELEMAAEDSVRSRSSGEAGLRVARIEQRCA